MGITKLFFGLKACQPNHTEKITIWFDKELRMTIEDIIVGEGHFFGIFNRTQSWMLHDHILRDKGYMIWALVSIEFWMVLVL